MLHGIITLVGVKNSTFFNRKEKNMLIYNIILLGITFLLSFTSCKIIDKKFNLRNKLYNKYKNSASGTWLTVLCYLLIILTLAIGNIDLKSDIFNYKLGIIYFLFGLAYFLDYRKYSE